MLKKFAAAVVTALMAAMPLGGIAHAANGPNLIANPSMETATVAGVPDGWADGSFGTNFAPATPTSYVTTEGHTGTHSLKTTITSYTAPAAATATTPAGEGGDGKWVFTSVPVTPGTNYEYTHWYKSDVDTEIDVQVTYSSAAVMPTGIDGCDTTAFTCTDNLITASAAANWTQIKTTYLAPAGAVSMTFFQPLNKVGTVQIDDADLHTYTPTGFTQGMVTLTFDDGWLDQYTNGRPVLNAAGVPVTYYLLTGTVTFPDYMTVADMQALGTDPVGNELASHTIDHCSLGAAGSTLPADPATSNCHVPLTTAEIDNQLGGSQVQLKAWFPTLANVAVNFASPYGEYDSTSMTEIAKYYRSHRSVEAGFNSKDNFNAYDIKVQNIVDGTTPAQVQAWVDQAKLDKTWLVLVYHRVLPTDPTAGVEDYNTTPANLATEVAYMKSSGIAIRTVNQALDEIAPQVGTITAPTPPAGKTGDVTGNGVVDDDDATLLFANWGKTGTNVVGDVNHNGVVNDDDATLLFANWSK